LDEAVVTPLIERAITEILNVYPQWRETAP
jgi:hypothetical protein